MFAKKDKNKSSSKSKKCFLDLQKELEQKSGIEKLKSAIFILKNG